MSQKNDHHFQTTVSIPLPQAIKGFLKAVFTIFFVPAHDTSLSITNAYSQPRQTTYPAIEEEARAIRNILEKYTNKQTPLLLNTAKLFGYTGVLMQFTSYLPELRPYARTPFSHIEALYQSITTSGKEKPLNFSEQLDLALLQTKGDVLEALWRLFITSRLYARWYDTSVICDFPDMTRTEVLDRMSKFSRAVAACKKYNPQRPQDASGDAYYCWTHALAEVLFTTPKDKKPFLSKSFARLLRHGTWLNHNLAHKFKAQALPSDHTLASKYGLMVGGLASQHLQAKPFAQHS